MKDKTNPVVIDAGCNIGEFSELVFKHNKGSVIHAFDLHKSLSPALSRKFKNYNFNFSQIALSDYSGRSGIESNSKNDRKAYLSKNGLKSVKVDKLDNLLRNFNFPSVAILKIDTEGNDYKVLLGSKKILKTTDIVVFEIMFKIIEYGITPQDAINFLKELGFRYFYRSTKYFGLVPISTIRPHEITTQNIVASRNNLRK